MAYQREFKPTKDFQWIVEPFIKDLPHSPHQESLKLRYPVQAESRVHYQWYNWLHHNAPHRFHIKTQIEEESCIIELHSAVYEGTVIREEPQRKPGAKAEDIDSLVGDVLANIREAKKE